jgi:hypothetical protein
MHPVSPLILRGQERRVFDYGMEIVTEELAASELESELPWIVEWLVRNSVQELYVTFGVGSVVPTERLWKPILVTAQDLTAFVREAIHAGSLAVGRTDLHVTKDCQRS